MTWIFRDLDLEEDSEFGYEIEYLCNRHFVKVRAIQINKEERKGDPSIPPQFKRQYWIAGEDESTALADKSSRPYQQITLGDFFVEIDRSAYSDEELRSPSVRGFFIQIGSEFAEHSSIIEA